MRTITGTDIARHRASIDRARNLPGVHGNPSFATIEALTMLRRALLDARAERDIAAAIESTLAELA